MHLNVSRHTAVSRYLTVTHSAKAGALAAKNAIVHAATIRTASPFPYRSAQLAKGAVNGFGNLASVSSAR